MGRNKEFSVNKGIPPFEIYTSDPVNTPETELETQLYFPVRQ